MTASRWVYLEDCTVVKVVEKAMLVENEKFDGGEAWIPLSQVEDPNKFEDGDEDITVGVTEWWCKKNDIEVD